MTITADKIKALYVAANELMCKLGAEGEIDTRDHRADDLMDALYHIDGGVYDTDKVFPPADQQQEPQDPYYWLRWEDQDAGVPVIVTRKPVGSAEYETPEFLLHAEIQDVPNPIISTTGGRRNYEDVAPDFSRRGHWKVSTPLQGKPEGLGDGAQVVTWGNSCGGEAVWAVHNVKWWPEITAFTVIQPESEG